MKVVLFGASGMVGQGVLRECLLDADVAEVVSVVRKPTGAGDPKLSEIVHPDFTDFTSLHEAFDGVDACFFCLGVSGAGMTEDAYRAITFDITLRVAKAMLRASPAVTFIYVSGQGTDRGGRAMWARVKGATEEALLAMSEQTYMFRPGFIRPMNGERSGTTLYRIVYAAAKPLNPLLARATNNVTSTVAVGRAMLSVAKHGNPKRILENRDINAAS
jgi:uncharacterized protein YbjT (DUF2867 family)